MKQVVIIGSGLSALSCAIALAEQGIRAVIASPYPSERAQSVMAALLRISIVLKLCRDLNLLQMFRKL